MTKKKVARATRRVSAGAVREPSAFVEVLGAVYQENGQATVKMHVGDVNQIVNPESSAVTKVLKKIRVTMNVEEDKTAEQNVVYKKNLWMEQTDMTGSPASNGTTSEGNPVGNKFSWDNGTPGNDFKTWAKNTYDNLDAEVKRHGIALIAVGAVAACALLAAIYGLF